MDHPRCVLLDRDGTINVEQCYLSSPDQLELLPAAAQGLRRMAQLGLRLAVVTNQSGIARGYFNVARLDAIHARLRKLLRDQDVEIDGIYYCPHHPDDDCNCRKPRIGLAEQAMQDLSCRPEDSFVIGDKPCDIEFGTAFGATTFLVRTGYGSEIEATGSISSNYIVDDLMSAAETIERLIEPDCSK